MGKENVELCDLPGTAVEDCDLVTTDVWTSMGDENESEKRKNLFKGYQINQNLFEKAKSDAIFLHCLPAHRGEEVETEVIDGANSRVWQQAHNRLHTSKALIEFLLVMARFIVFINGMLNCHKIGYNLINPSLRRVFY